MKIIGGLVFWGFLGIKLFGTSLAAWSYWWVLLPIVPLLSLLIPYLNL